MPTTKRTLQELAVLGGDLFDRRVRPALRPEDDGKFVAIDIETGAYEIEADELAACDRLRNRIPDAQIWLVRVGSPYLGVIPDFGIFVRRLPRILVERWLRDGMKESIARYIVEARESQAPREKLEENILKLGGTQKDVATAIYSTYYMIWSDPRRMLDFMPRILHVHGKFYAVVRWHGYYSSTDGATWTRLANQPGFIDGSGACPANPTNNACPEYRGSLSVREDTGEVLTIFVDASAQTTAAGGGIFVLSQDGGTWTQFGQAGVDS